MKKILTLLLSIFLLAGLMSCDNSTTDETETSSITISDDANVFTYQIDWDAYLVWGTFNASLKDTSDTVIIEGQGGSEPDAVSGSDASTESYFGDTGSSYSFVHDGSDSYGGVMTSFDGGADLSAMSEVKIAIKGDLSGLDALEIQLGDASSDQKLNILDYPTEALSSDDDAWIVYIIPLTEFDTLNFGTFDWASVWNPKSKGYTMADETGYGACDFLYDIAFN